MLSLEKRLTDYLEPIAGNAIVLGNIAESAQGALPLFLRQRYQLRRIRIFHQDCLLALEAPNWESASPAEYAAHAKALLAQLREPVTLVIPKVVSYVRNRMVQAGTPFIVPGSQLFMPFMMVDLRERFTSLATAPGQPLTPAAQVILLYHLLRKPLQGMPLQEIAKLTGYTGMTVTKVKDEWETNGLCQSNRLGRALAVEFPCHGRNLWQIAEPLLSSPTKKSNWVRWKNQKILTSTCLFAGYTALSKATMTEDDRTPTWAAPQNAYRKMLINGNITTVNDPEDADIRLEAWSYNPFLLSDGPCVDPLSLVLSLRSNRDDRVQQQLQTLLDRALVK